MLFLVIHQKHVEMEITIGMIAEGGYRIKKKNEGKQITVTTAIKGKRGSRIIHDREKTGHVGVRVYVFSVLPKSYAGT